METHSHSTKQPIKIIIPIIIVIITILLVVLFFFLGHSPQSTNLESAVGDWQNQVIPSDSLEEILETDFDKYTRGSIDTGLDEYFLSLYPNGTGLNLVNYDNEDSYSLQLITSYGTFHNMTVVINENSTTITIDDTFEKEYPIATLEREEE